MPEQGSSAVTGSLPFCTMPATGRTGPEIHDYATLVSKDFRFYFAEAFFTSASALGLLL